MSSPKSISGGYDNKDAVAKAVKMVPAAKNHTRARDYSPVETAFSADFMTSGNKDNWFIDTKALYHMTPRQDWFGKHTQPIVSEIISPTYSKMKVLFQGDINISVEREYAPVTVRARNVLCVPDLNVNLLSLYCMTLQGLCLEYHTGECRIYNSEFALLATATGYGHMFQLDVKEVAILVSDSADDDYYDFWEETNMPSF